MPYYLIRIAGRDLHTQLDGVQRRLGFFVNRVVRASTDPKACSAALERVRGEARQRMTPGSLPPRLGVDEVTKISWLDALSLGRQGFVFFPQPSDQAVVPDDAAPTAWLSYGEATARLADALERDAEAQQLGRDAALGTDFEEIEGRIPRGAGTEWQKVFLALAFWDYWLDARNHDWTAFYHVERDSWPLLARQVAAALRSGQEITDPVILALVA